MEVNGELDKKNLLLEVLSINGTTSTLVLDIFRTSKTTNMSQAKQFW